MIHVIDFNYKVPEKAVVVNSTSRSSDWGRGLSPFYCGPVEMYDGYVSQTVENCWQYSKVFEYYLDDGEVGESYFTWAKRGWAKSKADRYPMGRGVLPLYSYWAGEKLNYVEARKRIYIPMYASGVRNTIAYKKLEKLYKESGEIYIQSYDVHNLMGGTYDYWELAGNDKLKFGHGYVLGMMLEKII